MNFKKIVQAIVSKLSNNDYALKVFQVIVDELLTKVDVVRHNRCEMFFTVPNQITKFRAKSFSTKEPDTLEWIEGMRQDSVLWDIGANIGIYSIYAAKYSKCKVYAFEPSVFNLEFLARNIFLNQLQDTITIIPVALSNSNDINKFQMSNTSWGGALSTFGEGFDQFGDNLNNIVFEYAWPGMTMDSAPTCLDIELPTHIKIDVDGIEHLILKGGTKVLKLAESILLEVNHEFRVQSDSVNKILIESGFSLFKKCDMGDQFSYNLWWIRG